MGKLNRDKLIKWLEDKHDEAKRSWSYFDGMEEIKETNYYWGQVCAYRTMMERIRE